MATKTILFDLDGTLTDSGEGILNCATLALEHFNLPIPSREEMRIFVGPPLEDSFLRFGVPADKTDEAIAVYRSRYVTVGKFENSPYPGIKEVLAKLRRDGHTLCVATSKPEGMTMDIVNKFGLTQYFDLICGATLDSSRSKKADVIAYLLEKTGSAGNMVMVGDTIYDVLGAAEHGIPTVGVAWGYGLVEDMKKAGACAIAHTMDELYSLLNR